MRTVSAYLAAMMLAGCAAAPGTRPASSSSSATSESPAEHVAPEFSEACGKPGSEVVVETTPVTIRHVDCDLTGVVIVIEGQGGVAVPAPGAAAGSSSGVTVTRNAQGDVRVDATRSPGNA